MGDLFPGITTEFIGPSDSRSSSLLLRGVLTLFEMFWPDPVVTLSFSAKRHSTTEDTDPCNHWMRRVSKNWHEQNHRFSIDNRDKSLNQNVGGTDTPGPFPKRNHKLWTLLSIWEWHRFQGGFLVYAVRVKLLWILVKIWYNSTGEL